MNSSHAIFLVNSGARAVLCSYDDNVRNQHTIYKTLDRSIAVGDLVVVPTETRHNFTVVKVLKVDVDVNFDDTREMHWVVDKVDKPAYDDVLAKEASLIEAVRKAEFRKRRDDLADAIFKDQSAVAALPLASQNSDHKGDDATDVPGHS